MARQSSPVGPARRARELEKSGTMVLLLGD
jgi:hypothetical protein